MTGFVDWSIRNRVDSEIDAGEPKLHDLLAVTLSLLPGRGTLYG